MNKILIPHTKAYDAINWASEHFGAFGCEIQHTFPANMYEFRFYKSEQASMFALRWMQ